MAARGGLRMAQTKNVRILVADDSKLWQRMICEMLVEAGYEVHLASDGLECVRKLKYELDNVSLLLLDIRMPELDGFGVLRELKQAKLTADIPVLAISSDYREEHLESLKRLGATGYLNKKIPLEDIMFRINRILYPEKEDLRMSPRVEDNIFIRYRVNGSRFSGYSFNISSGGLFIRTIVPPPEKTKVRLSFNLPRNGKFIRAGGIITWRNKYRPDTQTSYPPGIGVKFTNLPSNDRDAIAQHILERLS